IDIDSGDTVRTIPTEIPAGFIPYGISRNGRTISYFNPDSKSYLLADCETGKPFGPPWVDSTGASPIAIAPSPDGTAAVVTTSASVHILFKNPAHAPLRFALPNAPNLTMPQFSPDGRLLAIPTMAEDGTIAVLAPQ